MDAKKLSRMVKTFTLRIHLYTLCMQMAWVYHKTQNATASSASPSGNTFLPYFYYLTALYYSHSVWLCIFFFFCCLFFCFLPISLQTHAVHMHATKHLCMHYIRFSRNCRVQFAFLFYSPQNAISGCSLNFCGQRSDVQLWFKLYKHGGFKKKNLVWSHVQ